MLIFKNSNFLPFLLNTESISENLRVDYHPSFQEIWDFPNSSVGKESACNAGNPNLIPGLGRSPGKGIGYPLQYSWASLLTQLVKNPPAMWETWLQSWIGKIPWRRKRLHTPIFWPGEFNGLYSAWGPKESDTTERLSLYKRSSKKRKQWILRNRERS